MSALPADQVPSASPAVSPWLTVGRGGTAGVLALYLSVCLHHFVTGRTGLGTLADVLLGLLLFVLSTSLYSLLGGALAATGGALWFWVRRKRPYWHGSLWQAGRREGWRAGPVVGGVALNSAWWAVVTCQPTYRAGAPGWEAPAGVQVLDAQGNPARPGRSPVRTLTYGSGTDRRRPEYGAEAALITAAVKAPSTLAPEPRGVLAGVRRWLWGSGRGMRSRGRQWPEPGGDIDRPAFS